MYTIAPNASSERILSALKMHPPKEDSPVALAEAYNAVLKSDEALRRNYANLRIADNGQITVAGSFFQGKQRFIARLVEDYGHPVGITDSGNENAIYAYIVPTDQAEGIKRNPCKGDDKLSYALGGISKLLHQKRADLIAKNTCVEIKSVAGIEEGRDIVIVSPHIFDTKIQGKANSIKAHVERDDGKDRLKNIIKKLDAQSISDKAALVNAFNSTPQSHDCLPKLLLADDGEIGIFSGNFASYARLPLHIADHYGFPVRIIDRGTKETLGYVVPLSLSEGIERSGFSQGGKTVEKATPLAGFLHHYKEQTGKDTCIDINAGYGKITASLVSPDVYNKIKGVTVTDVQPQAADNVREEMLAVFNSLASTFNNIAQLARSGVASHFSLQSSKGVLRISSEQKDVQQLLKDSDKPDFLINLSAKPEETARTLSVIFVNALQRQKDSLIQFEGSDINVVVSGKASTSAESMPEQLLQNMEELHRLVCSMP